MLLQALKNTAEKKPVNKKTSISVSRKVGTLPNALKSVYFLAAECAVPFSYT